MKILDSDFRKELYKNLVEAGYEKQEAQKIVGVKYYNALKDKCIMYINAGHISIYELENIEEEFTLYKKLGGNGHMDALIAKVRKLKTTQE